MQEKSFNIDSTLTLRSGHKIPLIGYGTYQLQGKYCIQGVKNAIKYGYTHIDTASIYRNENQIKQALKQIGISRQKLYITSKVNPAQQGYAESREAVEGILKRLGIDYLDLILIHWPGCKKHSSQSPKNKQLRLQTWNSLIQLKKQGKVRDIGVSNFLKHHLQHLLNNTNQPPSINQFQIHPLLWQQSTIQFCFKNNIAIQAYSPLARQDNKLFQNQIVKQIAKKYKKTIAQICLRWSLQHGFIILPKSKTQNRIKQNIQIYDFQLDQKDMKLIDSLKIKNVRTCWDPNVIKY